ncbi:MAG: hypothetical protein IPH28_08305 [Cytophagaceae bacterium]|nr:hypothetical protein [Cytophagaceae bacterium]
MEIIEQIEGEIRVAKIKSEAILINNLDDATQLLGTFITRVLTKSFWRNRIYATIFLI